MGNKNSYRETSNQQIFEILAGMNWRERLFKTFCFQFEDKIYKNSVDDKKYEIEWEEFQELMLNNFFDYDRNHRSYLIYNTFKQFFKLNGGKIKTYHVYMIYFPLVLHIDGTAGLNFLDLIFEKIIYNLEIETRENKSLNKNEDGVLITEKNYNETVDRLEKSADRKLISERKAHEDNTLIYSDTKLLELFNEYKQNNDSKKQFVRYLPYKIFKEIMIIYFHTNITFFVRAYKDMLSSFDPRKMKNKNLRKLMGEMNHENIKYDKITPENVERFIQSTLDTLIEKRDTLNTIKLKDEIMFTFDDIYVYYKKNTYFLNTYRCYREFEAFLNK